MGVSPSGSTPGIGVSGESQRITPQSVVIQRLPAPDYAHHPAYGLLFGRPSLSTRFRAASRFLPAFVEQLRSIRHLHAHLTHAVAPGGDESLHSRLCRDGAAAVRFDPGEIEDLRVHIEPFLNGLRTRRAAIPPRRRTFKDMFLGLSVKTAPAVIRCVRDALNRHGVVSAASRYLDAHVVMREVVRLQITDAHDAPWHAHFDDIGLSDPATTYMHIDSETRFLKAMLYVNEVTRRNGPFACVLGTHCVRMSHLEYMIRKANDRSRLDRCDRGTRELFSSLPAWLQLKGEFGNDLENGSPEVASLLACEHQFTSTDGDLIVFDNNAAHRGMKVVDGERHAIQIQLRPVV